MKKILLFLVLPLIIFAKDETNTGSDEDFLFDAVVFKGDSTGLSRLDIFVVIPYQTLEFVQSGDIYGSKYDIIIDIYNINSTETYNDKISKVITAEDYYISQGGSGEFDFNQKVFYLPSGEYRLKVTMRDKISDREYQRSRKITVLDFYKYDFSLSGLLLVSSIESINGKNKINPHISDDIAPLHDNFFVFFESYNNKKEKEVALKYEILLNDDEVKTEGEIEYKTIKSGTQQNFIKIPSQDKLPTGNYTLKISAFNSDSTKEFTDDNLIAVTQRSIKIRQSIAGNILKDLDNAIRQLRYVAYQDEIEKIEKAPSRVEKEHRFLMFWKSKDPSPNTELNEAMIEYYSRIKYANNAFKSYTEGWMTDKGMVFVIYGKPYSAEKQNNYNDNRIYEVWRYRNNREFIFVDNSGFGDFRLLRPATIQEKYQYGR